MSRVVVCGSLNMDVVVQSARRPATGETILGATVSFLPGGKGLNQAVAAARLGVPTAMIGAVGNDAFANSLRAFLADNDVDCRGVREIDGPATGVALIQVAQRRQRDHRRLRRQSPFHQGDGPRGAARRRSLGRAVRDADRRDRGDPEAGARRRRPHHPEPRAVRAARRPPDEGGRRGRAERDRAVAGDRREAAGHERAARHRRRLREAARQGRARRRGDPGRARRRRGDGRRRDRDPRLQGQGRRHDRRRRLLRRRARGPAVGRRHARRGGALCQRRSRPVPSSGWVRRPRCRRHRKLRRGWRGLKSPAWSKNSSGRTPISRTPKPP